MLFRSDYIYANLGMDLDYILPFAGIPENGREIDGLDDKSELAHRMMLVNLLRILGAIMNKKASRHLSLDQLKSYFHCLPTMAFSETTVCTPSPRYTLRLSSNDGLLKVGANTSVWLVQSLGPTNIVAHELESHGVRTFSAKEMAFNILGLMHLLLFSITQVEPIWADLNGGMAS